MVETLIDKLIDHRIRFELVEENNLKIHADINSIPGELLSELRQKKQELVDYLLARQSPTVFGRIGRSDQQESYPLSSNQRRLWILSQFEDKNVAYNILKTFSFNGALDPQALSHAFNQVIERHESLRTVFRENGRGEVRQYIVSQKNIGFAIETSDLRGEPVQEKAVQGLIILYRTKPFDLAQGPLLRALLIRTDDDRWVIAFVMHHIISDAWSLNILLSEVLKYYAAFLQGIPDPLPPLRIQFKDYVAWQQQMLADSLQSLQTYWLKQFEGELPVLDIPGDKMRPVARDFNAGAVIRKTIGAAEYKGIQSLCHETGATLFMGLLAAVNVLLYRYTGQEDIIIGTPIAGREHIDLEDQIGFYVNTLALRTRFNGSDNFRQLLDNVKQVALGAYRNQLFPFDELVDALHLRNDTGRNPLFDVQVIVQNNESKHSSSSTEPSQQTLGRFEGVINNGAVFDIVFHFTERQNSLDLHVVYNSSVYSSRSIEQLTDHLEVLLSSMIHHPGEPVKSLAMLRETEIEKLLNHFNNYQPQKWGHKTIMELFSAQVKIAPDAAAVVAGNKTLSYAMLEQRSSELAGYLRRVYDVKKEELIGVMLDRTEAAVIALLGIMKSGAAYVPIDPSYPQQRKEYMLRDSAVRILLTQTGYLFDLSWYQGEIVAMDLEGYSGDTTEAANVNGSDLAYVIYTSGSTGLPKGVMIGHRALSAAVETQLDVFDIARETRVLQFTSFSFDVSVFEMLITLLSGACLYIIDEESRKDPALMQAFIKKHLIEIVAMTPSTLRMLDMAQLTSLNKLITGGETADTEQVNMFCQHGDYYNCYGPTESALCASIYPVSRGERVGNNIPIGTPLSHTHIYILDSSGNLVPVGVSGEICIGGLGVARGYLNQPQQTAQRFVDDPFEKGSTMYRTGDLGRWTSTGLLEFMGRKDSQLKINGYRVEPGEIEQAIKSYGSIQSAVVLGRDNDRGDKELVAWLVGDFDMQQLRAYLSSRLPVYMIPAHFVQLDALPLTPNGKTDTARLPMPEGAAFNKTCEAARTETERAMVRVWEQILGIHPIGITDDFFELGGSSLKAMIVAKKTMDELGFSIPIKIIFEQRCIASIAAYIDNSGDKIISPYINSRGGDAVITDASYNQRSYFSAWNKEGDHLVVLQLEVPDINTELLRQSVLHLVARHEILRTVFTRTAGGIQQQVLEPASLNIVIDEEATIDIEQEYARVFDPGTFPLFHINVTKGQERKIIFTIHHIITDGHSTGILKKELVDIYRALQQGFLPSLPPLPFQYKDFADWQHNFVNSPEGARHQAYWLKKLAAVNMGFDFAADNFEPVAGKEDLNSLSCLIAGEWYQSLDRFGKEQGITRTSMVLAALVLTLYRTSARNDITICTSVSGRNSQQAGAPEVNGLIGFFANLLLVRNRVNEQDTMLQFLRQVQNNFLEDLGFDAYPFEKLVHELSPVDTAAFLDASVFFNYHNYSYQQQLVYDTQESHTETMAKGSSKKQIAFVLSVTEYSNCLRIEFVFSPHLVPYRQRLRIKDIFLHTVSQSIEKAHYSIKKIYNYE